MVYLVFTSKNGYFLAFFLLKSGSKTGFLGLELGRNRLLALNHFLNGLFMTIELTKGSKEEILNHIAKQAGKRALKVAVCVAVVLFVFFFVIINPLLLGNPHFVFV